MPLCVRCAWVLKYNTMLWRRGIEFSGGRQNYRLGAVGNPHFRDFTNRNDFPVAKPSASLAKLREIQRASIESDFRGKSNSSLNRRAETWKAKILFYGEVYISVEIMKKNEVDFKCRWHGVIIGRFGETFLWFITDAIQLQSI